VTWIPAFADFEYATSPRCGLPTKALCLVVKVGGVEYRYWLDGNAPEQCPFDFDAPGLVMVAWHLWAEASVFELHGWTLPKRMIDLAAEWRLAVNNGHKTRIRFGLHAALGAMGLEPEVSDSEKKGMQILAGAGGPFADTERARLLEYCASDVRDTERLWHRVWDDHVPVKSAEHRWTHAMLRGRYAAIAGKMYLRGVPVDGDAVTTLVEHKDTLRSAVIGIARQEYPGLYDGERLPQENFGELLRRVGAYDAWPRTHTGQHSTHKDVFKRMTAFFPELHTLGIVKQTTAHLSKVDYRAELDRAHVMPGLWVTDTGRSNPTNTRFVLSGPRWTRAVVTPAEGTVLLDCDFSAQEFMINAVLSGDQAMIRAYESGDPYMSFAIDAGLAPEGATKRTHGTVRKAAKECALGIGYGQSAWGLMRKLRRSSAFCQDLIDRHKRTYPRFHAWNTLTRARARDEGVISTALGWHQGVGSHVKENTLRNFQAQAGGGDILRLAVIALDDAGYRVLATNHDSILLEVPLEDADDAAQDAPEIMAAAGTALLRGHRLRVDRTMLYPGQRLLPSDPSSLRFWTVFEQMRASLDRGDGVFGIGGRVYQQSEFFD
jgi:DNA polymerase I-like protein with 3'-5' exonuclease and polymerase domains